MSERTELTEAEREALAAIPYALGPYNSKALHAAIEAILAARLEQVERERERDVALTEISNRHFEHDQALAESCDTCHVLTAYAEREQRWHWNLIREQVAQNAQEKAEAALADLQARIETLAATWEGDSLGGDRYCAGELRALLKDGA